MGVFNPLYSYVSFESFLNHQTTLPLPPNMWYRTVFNMHKSNRSCTVPKFFRPFDINFFKLMVKIISSFSFIFSPLFFSLYLPLPLFHLLSSPIPSICTTPPTSTTSKSKSLLRRNYTIELTNQRN